ncbi:PadR family transcriptional regulator [candidate division KSB1 bacterium]
MKLLSRPEELVLLAIWHLNDDAYCVPIRERIIELTDKDWSFGSVYIPLNRLEKKGLIASNLGDPTSERGGRAKRFYVLTRTGKEALQEVRALNAKMWQGMPDTI